MMRVSLLPDPQKIMVRAANWIGDAVMSIPALDALRARVPRAEIVLVAKPWVSEIYRFHPAVDRLMVYDPKDEHKGAGGFRKFVQALRAEEFDVALLFQNSFHAAWMAWRAGIPARVGFARDGRSALLTEAVAPLPPSALGHQAYSYLHLLFRAGLIDKPRPVAEARLALAGEEKKWAAQRLESLGLPGNRVLVALNPGASFGPAKRWPAELFADLADRLIGALYADVLIFGSREEKALAEEVARAMKHTPAVLAGETTLREWMALMAQCRLAVSNDSGPMHLAAALGLPLVSVFGSTDPRATGPLSPRARVVRHAVACSPCGLRECPIDFRCMRGVTVEEVLRAALEAVKQIGK